MCVCRCMCKEAKFTGIKVNDFNMWLYMYYSTFSQVKTCMRIEKIAVK